MDTATQGAAAVFEADLSSQGEAFPLLLLAIGARFMASAPATSRLYFSARVSYLLAPADLHLLMTWLVSDQRIAHFLPESSGRQRILDDFKREYPLPFFASQRLVLAGGRVVLDLLVEKNAASSRPKFSVVEALEGCQIKRHHDLRQPRIAILGSGLAGCNLAAALAARGAMVSVFERNPEPHTGASGNRQGALYIKPALAWSRENRLHVLSYQYAHRFYQRHFGNNADTTPKLSLRQPWQHCGVLHLAQNEREQQRMSQLHEQSAYPEGFIRPLSPLEAAKLSGTNLDCPAAAMPHGGTLEPAKLCQQLLATHGIEVVTGRSIDDSIWDAVVWAGGHPHPEDPLAPSALPLRPIRGQISSVRISEDDQPIMTLVPRQVLSGDGYVMPPLQNGARSSWLTYGASYAVNRSDRAISEAEMADNSRQLAKTLPDLAGRLETEKLEREERAAIRCASTDYMPVVGQARLAHLRKDPTAGHGQAEAFCRDGKLWFMTAFGSKGLALAPLLAEQLACAILDEPMPLETDLSDGCDPERWARRAALKAYSPSTSGTG